MQSFLLGSEHWPPSSSLNQDLEGIDLNKLKLVNSQCSWRVTIWFALIKKLQLDSFGEEEIQRYLRSPSAFFFSAKKHTTTNPSKKYIYKKNKTNSWRSSASPHNTKLLPWPNEQQSGPPLMRFCGTYRWRGLPPLPPMKPPAQSPCSS